MPGGRVVAIALVGAGAVAAALVFGTPVLLPLGIGLVLLAALAAGATALAVAGASARRTVVPARLPAGARARLEVRVRTGPARGALIRALDRDLDPGTGPLPATPLRRPDGGGAAVSLGPLPRGVHRLPDPVLAVSDPFAVSARRRRLPAPAEVVALPAVVELPAPFWERGGAGRPGARARAAPQGWHELDGVRDYQPGDPLQRIHWGQTAKRGRLQTKELRGSEDRGAGVLVLLDCARAGGVDGGPAGPFEVAVSAAASLAHHLAHRGEPVSLVLTSAAPLRIAGADAWAQAEDALARVRADGDRPASAALRAAVAEGPSSRVVVLVTAAPDGGLAPALRAAAAARTRVAVVLAGPAAAGAAEACRRGGAPVAVATRPADLAAALSAHRPHEATEPVVTAGA